MHGGVTPNNQSSVSFNLQAVAPGLGKTTFIKNLQDMTDPESAQYVVPALQRCTDPCFCNEPETSCTPFTLRKDSCWYCYRFQVHHLVPARATHLIPVLYGMHSSILCCRPHVYEVNCETGQYMRSEAPAQASAMPAFPASCHVHHMLCQ